MPCKIINKTSKNTKPSIFNEISIVAEENETATCKTFH